MSEKLYAVVAGPDGLETEIGRRVYEIEDAVDVARRESKHSGRRYNVYKLVQTHTFKYATCPGCEGCGKVEEPGDAGG